MSSLQELNNGLLYINSFVKRSGTDYNFSVTVPGISCSQLTLIQAGIDMWTPNFYDTTNANFSQFGLQISGVIYNCDIFISSLDEFVLWFNAQSPRYKLQRQANPSYFKGFTFRIQDSQNSNVYVNTALIGDGWQKLGFVDFTSKQTHTGSRIADLSLSPHVLIRIKNPPIKNNIQSNIGQAHFSIPNQASFGGKLIYNNEYFSDPRNTIYFDSPVQIQNFEVELLNCDFANLYTCDYGNGRDNNDAEVVLVFATRK